MLSLQDIDSGITARFWTKVDQSGGPDACWPWTGGRKETGYGNFFVKRDTPGKNGRMLFVNAHKFAYLISKGDVPTGMVVRHTCDYPPCCNPVHLIPGTMKMNIADGIERGRINPSANGKRGAALGGQTSGQKAALFRDEDVTAIIYARAYGETLQSIANRYQTSENNVFNALTGRTYHWIPIVQRIRVAYAAGEKFPRTDRRNYSIDMLPPLLRAVIEDGYE